MDCRRQGAACASKTRGPTFSGKKNSTGLTAHFEQLWGLVKPAFRDERTWERARRIALSNLACLGRHTVTGMLASCGQQFADWSATYRLFAKNRIDMEGLWNPVSSTAAGLLPEGFPFVAMLDDTLATKRGRKIPGTSWRRDPLGPPFATNFVWAQRFLQVACAIPEDGFGSAARAIPVEMSHCPTPKRPTKWATDDDWSDYRRQQREMRISTVACERIASLRHRLDAHDVDRRLLVAVDGAYTNNTVFRNIPERTAIIGRIRKDAKLYELPPPNGTAAGRGRRRVYGNQLPTPEQIRQDETIPWQQIEAYAAGKTHNFDVKVVGPVRWRGAGDRDLRLIVIRPLGYRPSKSSPLLYRKPAYIVCTDHNLDVAQILQVYLWRWEVEVAFRDQKTLIGLGEAQVRNENSAVKLPVFVSATYAYLQLAAIKAGLRSNAIVLPKWRKPKEHGRCTTANVVSLLRAELWGKALGVNINDFATTNQYIHKAKQTLTQAAAAVIYAHR